MTIVANTYMLNIFKQITLFKINLGGSIVPVKDGQSKDPFTIKYINMTGKQILTYGTIGKLVFYQDYTLPQREYYIFNDDSVYNIMFTNDDLKISPNNYLASIIKEITDKEGIKNTQETEEIKKPAMSLPTDQYIEEMIKKRKTNDQ